MNNTTVSKSDAQAALDDIATVIQRTRKAIATGPTAPILILWGVIWVIGYSITHFQPQLAGFAWFFLVLLGSLSSWWMGVKIQSPIQSPHDAKIGLFWLVLFAYATAWLLLLSPIPLPKGEEWLTKPPITDKQTGAFFATVAMFAYVVGGLWLGKFFIGLGLSVTVLTLGGYFMLNDIFNLWMAFTGGGSLILAGLYVQKYWK